MMTDYGVLKPLVESSGVIVDVGLAITGALVRKGALRPAGPDA
jgi:hypothetical protein